MASTVLNRAKALAMSIYVVRAFVRLREVLAANSELTKRLDELEARLDNKLGHHQKAIAGILSAIRQLEARRMRMNCTYRLALMPR